MSPYVCIDTSEVRLIDHGKFKFLSFGGFSCDNYQVERSLQNGGIRDRVDRVKSKEYKGLFEPPRDACREEEKEA